MQLSIISQKRTTELLERLGYSPRVVDFSFFELGDLPTGKHEQISRVEAQSDASHQSFGDTDVMIADLLEITRDRQETHAR